MRALSRAHGGSLLIRGGPAARNPTVTRARPRTTTSPVAADQA